MTIKSSLLLAYRILFPKGESSAARQSLSASLLCIGISLVPLIVVLAVSNGMIQGMTERIIGLSSSHIEAAVESSSPFVSDAASFTRFASRLKTVEGVTNAYPEIDASALASGASYRCGVQVRAVLPEVFTENKSFASLFRVTDGDIGDFKSGAKAAVVGEETAKRLGIRSGDKFRLITAQANADGTVLPKAALLSVAAVVSSGYQELDAAWLFVPLDTGFDIIRAGTGAYSVLVETENAFSPELVRVQNSLRDAFPFDADFYRWDELNLDKYENFASTKIMLVFIMLLIVLVASINISSSLVMLVAEKRREIAVIKSLGGTRHGIAFAFLAAGTAAGFGGVLIGLPIGLACAVNVKSIIVFFEKSVNAAAKFLYIIRGYDINSLAHIDLMDPAYYLSEISVVIPFRDTAVIVVSTVLLALAASVIPAYRAGNEKPLETLRKV
ncbi:ABC transporter permease [Treponema socranskii]|uniref:ABC transporter permease n=1 Tax=Treponema socranskii TaxID=53419 RepID=UPI0028722614|nr:FtsX-like permease family protein [Treponema socranskii]MDR9859554.1 FtsX-like permease family protein [Treponema socranskii]